MSESLEEKLRAARDKPWPDYGDAVAEAKKLGCTCGGPIWGVHWPGLRDGATSEDPQRDKRCPLASSPNP